MGLLERVETGKRVWRVMGNGESAEEEYAKGIL
jgi:hypothetical protein